MIVLSWVLLTSRMRTFKWTSLSPTKFMSLIAHMRISPFIGACRASGTGPVGGMIFFSKFVVTKLSAEVYAKVPSLWGFPDGKGFLIVHVDKSLCAVCEKYLHETFLTVIVVSVIVCLWVPCRASIRGKLWRFSL